MSQNPIAERQNGANMIRIMSGAGHLYQAAKKVAMWQFGLTVSVPIGLSVTSMLKTDLAGWVALYSLLIALIDPILFDGLRQTWRQRAARFQELFDCGLFELSWNDPVCGEPPTPEEVHRAAAKYRGNEPRDWYPKSTNSVPLEFARLICQRSSMAWDCELRRRYLLSLKIVGAVLVIASLIAAFGLNLAIQTFVLSVLAPAVPVFQWGIKETKAHQESISKLERLTDYWQSAWRDILAMKDGTEAAYPRSRNIQDGLYLHRGSASSIPQPIYNLFRPAQENEMNAAAEHLVAEALRALELPRTSKATH